MLPELHIGHEVAQAPSVSGESGCSDRRARIGGHVGDDVDLDVVVVLESQGASLVPELDAVAVE